MDKKEAKLQYKLDNRPMGIYQIRNLVNGKIWVNSSLNLPGSFNGDRVKLNGGPHHPSPSLLAEWKEFGESNFVFEVLEELFPRPDANYDYKGDLAALKDLWLEKLEPFGEKGYNEPKRTFEERLRMIADKGLSK